jgi:hypothetical protein
MHVVILRAQQVAGPGSTPVFTVPKGPYEVGCAYDCQSAQTAEQSLEILDVVVQGATSTAFHSTDLQGSGTLVVSATGDQKLEIDTAAGCKWVIEVAAP